MKQLFPHMHDSPEHHAALGGLIYGAFPFVVLPFSLVLLIIGVKDDGPYVVLEYIFQAVNFVALCLIYREYLPDSWLNVGMHPRRFWSVCLGSAAAIVAIYLASFFVMKQELYPKAGTVFYGILPMTGLELLRLPGEFALQGGFLATVFLIVLGPVITACMYYAPVFAPQASAGRKLWAYAAVAAWIALPRIITYHTSWGGWKELELYLAQMPVHLLACWGYQKTNTIWAPIFTHAIANTVCCCMLWSFHVLNLLP